MGHWGRTRPEERGRVRIEGSYDGAPRGDHEDGPPGERLDG